MVSRIIRWLAILSVMSGAVYLLWFAAQNSQVASHRDIAVFWAAERLFVAHANPYDPASMMRLELTVGTPIGRPVMMLNPPTALPFAIPLGFCDFHTAVFVWAVITFAALFVSVRILRVLNSPKANRSYLICYAFAPALACIAIGQYSIIVLLGAVIFLWLHRSRPFLAGLSVALMATKPHLLMPIGLVALVWSLRERRFTLLAGALVGLAAAAVSALLIDPAVFAQFMTVSRAGGVDIYGAPNFSSLLRRLDPGAAWLQYALAIGATIWGLAWYWRRRDGWDWNDSGLILLCVAVITAPHSWLDDEVLMIPALVAGLSLSQGAPRALVPLLALNSVVLLFLYRNVPFYSWSYLWTSVAWLLWFLDVRWLARTGRQNIASG